MRLKSSRDTLVRSEISLLAIVESAVASGVSVFIAWRMEYFWHIAIGALLSPFLLLRIPQGTRCIIIKLHSFYNRCDTEDDSDSFTAITKFIFFTLSAPLYKTIISVKIFFLRPFLSLKAIPENYFKNVFVVDSCISPHLIPGYFEWQRKSEQAFHFPSSYRIISGAVSALISKNIFKTKKSAIVEFALYCIFSISMLPIIIAAFSYRFAVKSTALVWLPLLWIMYLGNPGRNINDRLRLIYSSSIAKISVIYSVIVLLFFFAKMMVVLTFWKWQNQTNLGIVGKFIDRIVDPLNLPLWQLAGALNALLYIVFILRVERHVIARGSAEAYKEIQIITEFIALASIRAIISVYTISCFIYIIVITAAHLELEPIKIIIIPS